MILRHLIKQELHDEGCELSWNLPYRYKACYKLLPLRGVPPLPLLCSQAFSFRGCSSYKRKHQRASHFHWPTSGSRISHVLKARSLYTAKGRHLHESHMVGSCNSSYSILTHAFRIPGSDSSILPVALSLFKNYRLCKRTWMCTILWQNSKNLLLQIPRAKYSVTWAGQNHWRNNITQTKVENVYQGGA